MLPYKITRAGFWLLAYTCKCWYSDQFVDDLHDDAAILVAQNALHARLCEVQEARRGFEDGAANGIVV